MAQFTIQQAFDLAVRHHQAGRLQEAERVYRQILAQQPKHTRALHYLGMIAHQTGRNDDAVDFIRRSIALSPNIPEAHNDLGIALHNKGELDEAIIAFRQGIALKHNFAEAYSNLGILLTAKGQIDEAIAALRQAVAFKPNHSEAHHSLGNALRDKGHLDEAIACFHHAIRLNPNFPEAYTNLGNALAYKGQLDEAIAAFGRAIVLTPNFAQAHNNIGNVLKDKGELDGAIVAYRRAMALAPDNAAIDSNLVYTLHFHPGYDARAIAEEHRRWKHQHAEPLGKFIQPHTNDRDPDRRLRIGYVSPDFREHVVGQNLLPLFQHHDHRQFEITCYAHVISPDAMTSRLQQKADRWRNIVGLSDERVDQQIREDRIDILVDLTLHMAKNRLLVFARKPAPVQVCYLGYCGSTGLATMDYRLSDPHLDLSDADLSFYTEKTVRLPKTYWCYQLGTDIPASPLPARKNGFVTFGCLNNFAKVSLEAMELWAGILMGVPDSRLILHAHPGKHLDEIAQRLDRAGVAKSRLIVVGQQSGSNYMETYRRIDIALDPFPYGGGITTCDALWMGVPVVTLSGQTAVGRGGRSILSNLGLRELIAFTPDEYVQIAVDLAKDENRMDSLRQSMRCRMQSSPLMDAQGFARDMETAYRQMWQTWCATGLA